MSPRINVLCFTSCQLSGHPTRDISFYLAQCLPELPIRPTSDRGCLPYSTGHRRHALVHFPLPPPLRAAPPPPAPAGDSPPLVTAPISDAPRAGRYMGTCFSCPKQYPWLYDVDGDGGEADFFEPPEFEQ